MQNFDTVGDFLDELESATFSCEVNKHTTLKHQWFCANIFFPTQIFQIIIYLQNLNDIFDDNFPIKQLEDK